MLDVSSLVTAMTVGPYESELIMVNVPFDHTAVLCSMFDIYQGFL